MDVAHADIAAQRPAEQLGADVELQIGTRILLAHGAIVAAGIAVGDAGQGEVARAAGIAGLQAVAIDVVERGERVLVTTLTKRMAEELTDYYAELGVKVRYLHSDIDTLERVEILRDLRAGEFDVLVGINLLREGLDLPEVSLVAILDADKEGFLRSPRSLIQTIGRAARNANGQVFMYADRITDAMKQAMSETERRRKLQIAYNQEHGITPETIKRAILEMNPASGQTDYYAVPRGSGKGSTAQTGNGRGATRGKPAPASDAVSVAEQVLALRQQMFAAAENLQFETAARLRDEIRKVQAGGGLSEPALEAPPASAQRAQAKPARRGGAQSARKRR